MSRRFDGNISPVDCYVANAINIENALVDGRFKRIWVNPIELHPSFVQPGKCTKAIIGPDSDQ